MTTTLKRCLPGAFLACVFLFLYVPIASVVFYSFNASKLVTVWTGFSLRWYGALAQDAELIDAALASLKIAVATACASVVIGTWIGYVLSRGGRFRGFTLFAAMTNAPLVLPEVIQGISLLLLFIGLQQAFGWSGERGMVSIWIGHVMLCLSYVAITVQSRLATLDKALEEAARDLGAPPWRVFFDVTLPLIAPALVSGWLLAFTISMDDIIMSAFLSGPGSTLLPLVVLSRVRLGLNPEINALGTLVIALVSVTVVANNCWMLRRARRRDRELAQPARERESAAAMPQAV
ncbi:ABC transporter permease subunit [Burkholderia pseudomultivorans]|uniref:Inner membrane ABC transporter permease protein YdcV n=1 Tax=Burkholderia pseudomultivorans TaxID=1207504 RepID=A0ABU2E3P2_9BURK|nr:ABC transporter permease subunit [Burkholderia pseudomultivorans]MDR8729632.1 Inner membrane ABC transporter permease protein YdcV [Burkholderia pseudomultivorans]MDR8737031.1 Inner membrane ABC transporter permease protein YdcV [Burkholderia pseudomultivorans]MDR8743074.1 Inner membrane ABC transporter permease protein YdcV [Burkholderia pseudomultivorans]MDR8754449.1 Inner membrane ABC transporter permease protein YdcV [Burkholderia pseudomultivorans]MDR8779802.1 Inner membrane ABC transp